VPAEGALQPAAPAARALPGLIPCRHGRANSSSIVRFAVRGHTRRVQRLAAAGADDATA
jgi:hypothetical protein